jgi:zona occludens toxin
MALNCYTGLMGSGKSYEVVSTILLNALRSGRRVVSNIDGLDLAAITEYIFSHFKDTVKVGELVHVSNDEVVKPGFFPTDKTVGDQKSRVKPGDLVLLDEVWRFWGTGEKVPTEHFEFLRMHRHYVCPDGGYGCDIGIMIQDIASLNRQVRAVVEFSTKTVKLKALGLHKRYRVEMYETGILRGSTHLDTFVKSYNPEIFPLYSSYKGGSGKELVVDNRQNIIANRKWYYIFGVIAVIAILYFSIGRIWRYFHNSGSSAASIVAASSGAAIPSVDPLQSDLRYVGKVNVPNLGELVVFANAAGRLRYENAALCSGPAVYIRCKIDGKFVNAYSGTVPSPVHDKGFLGFGGKS